MTSRIDLLKSLTDHFLLHTDCAAIILEKEFDGISFCYEILDNTVINEIQGIEYALSLFCMELQLLIGKHWRPTFTQFRYSAPKVLGPLKKVFGFNIRFNQTKYAFHISQEDLELSLLTSNKKDYKLIKKQLKSRFIKSNQAFSMRVEIAIRAIISMKIVV